MVVSKTRGRFIALWRFLQSSFVKTLTEAHCKLAAVNPGLEVWPHPAVIAVPVAMWVELKTAGAILAVVTTAAEVWSKQISLLRLFALYEGWLTRREIVWLVPPVVLLSAESGFGQINFFKGLMGGFSHTSNNGTSVPCRAIDCAMRRGDNPTTTEQSASTKTINWTL